MSMVRLTVSVDIPHSGVEEFASPQAWLDDCLLNEHLHEIVMGWSEFDTWKVIAVEGVSDDPA